MERSIVELNLELMLRDGEGLVPFIRERKDKITFFFDEETGEIIHFGEKFGEGLEYIEAVYKKAVMMLTYAGNNKPRIAHINSETIRGTARQNIRETAEEYNRIYGGEYLPARKAG